MKNNFFFWLISSISFQNVFPHEEVKSAHKKVSLDSHQKKNTTSEQHY